MRLLILGGTFEARRLCQLIADDMRFETTVSLAGRTARAREMGGQARVGGFGGVEGLSAWLKARRIDAVIDATHPFAARISAHAVEATRDCGIPLGSIVRPAWERRSGDQWIDVQSVEDAARALPDEPSNVFLSIGRLGLGAFAGHGGPTFLARTIDPAGDIALPRRISFVTGQGPFAVDDELALLKEHRIDIVVTKNSGGPATVGKITAARELGLAVIMVARPDKPTGVVCGTPDDAVLWLGKLASGHVRPRSERGV